MKLSADGVAVMHHFEGCKLEAYPDPGSKDGKPWTIGFGHTGPEVVRGLKWTQAQADTAFLTDVGRFERAVDKAVTVGLTQRQFDALVAFTYNLGEANLKSSTLLKKLNAGDYTGAKSEFARWNKNDGAVMKGLTRRRAAEAALFGGVSGREAIAIGDAA